MDKDDFPQMKPSITRYLNEITGIHALALDRRSQHEEMIEPAAAALMYETYFLVATKTNPHYAMALMRMLMDHLGDIRNIIERDERPPFQQP